MASIPDSSLKNLELTVGHILACQPVYVGSPWPTNGFMQLQHILSENTADNMSLLATEVSLDLTTWASFQASIIREVTALAVNISGSFSNCQRDAYYLLLTPSFQLIKLSGSGPVLTLALISSRQLCCRQQQHVCIRDVRSYA